MLRVTRVGRLKHFYKKRVGYISYNASPADPDVASNRSKVASKRSLENVNNCVTNKVDVSSSISRYVLFDMTLYFPV